MNMHAQALRGSDGHLIRLCKKTIDAKLADLAAGEAKAEAQTVYEGQAPAYPVLPLLTVGNGELQTSVDRQEKSRQRYA